jgi:hypothetical protein
MKKFTQPNRSLIILNLVVFLCLAVAWILYALFGHRLIEAMYNGESIGFLNSIIEGQSIHPLERYFQDANRMMWVASLIVVGFAVVSSVSIKAFPALASILESAAPWLSRVTIAVLTPIVFLFSLAASAIVFFYPLEIETRESTVWLHILALKENINIYDHSQVAFSDMMHGPFNPLVKFWIATLFPFLQSWQVTRLPVFLLPFGFVLIAWKLIGKSSIKSQLLHILYLGSLGFLFLLVSAKEFLLVGRSDATAALFLLALIYTSVFLSPKTNVMSLLHGVACGVLAISIVLTNWRITPIVLAVLIFTLWLYWDVHQATKKVTGTYLVSYAVVALGIWGVLVLTLFDGNLGLYYAHFVGSHLFPPASGGNKQYEGSVVSFVVSLFNPTARPDDYKGGPLLLALAVYALTWAKSDALNNAWRLLGVSVLAFCAIAHYYSYHGGGSWYFIPFLIVLWFYLCTAYSRTARWRLAVLGICVLVLTGVNARTVVFPTLQRAIRMSEADSFMAMVRSLDQTNSVLSEDTFFFRKSYDGDLIDMGDYVSIFANSGYFGEEFSKTAKRQFERTRRQPPNYILTGFTASPELNALIKENYVLLAKGPDNLTGNGHYASQLFMRQDLFVSATRPAGLERANLYGAWEMQVSNLRIYRNPFDFTEIELQATFTAPSGRKINFFGFYDGDGKGGQTGNVWKLRFMPDELGAWSYTYTWTDKMPGGAGAFTVVDSGLPGPLKIATDNPWYFMTGRGEPFHARPYGMMDYGPRIKSSSGWESNSQEYIETLKTKVIARGYNMVMASGPNRFGEGRSYWWKGQTDIFDVAVWNEYETVLRFALDNHLYFFPFDGMAEQDAFGMPFSRLTKYISGTIPMFDLSAGRVTPAFKRYMVARYGAFGSYMGYSPTWEWPEFWSETAANKFMSEIRSWNPFPTLLTAHDSSRSTFVGWMGFSMRQAGWKVNDVFGGNCRTCGQHGGIEPPFDNRPIFASEDIWEALPYETWYYPHNPTELRRGAWGAMMAGVMPVYSDWLGADMMGNGPSEPEVRRMFDFLYSKTRYRRYQQLNQLVSRSARQIASGIPGQEYLVYDEDGGSIAINLADVSSATKFSVLWYDPKTGVEESGGSITGGASKTLTASFPGDTVLLLRQVPAGTNPGAKPAGAIEQLPAA